MWCKTYDRQIYSFSSYISFWLRKGKRIEQFYQLEKKKKLNISTEEDQKGQFIIQHFSIHSQTPTMSIFRHIFFHVSASHEVRHLVLPWSSFCFPPTVRHPLVNLPWPTNIFHCNEVSILFQYAFSEFSLKLTVLASQTTWSSWLGVRRWANNPSIGKTFKKLK